ncbi:MAG: type II secretion system ATPase GspE [Thioalkalivibrionaceae bacterium]
MAAVRPVAIVGSVGDEGLIDAMTALSASAGAQGRDAESASVASIGAASVATVARIPFGFARRHGVMLIEKRSIEGGKRSPGEPSRGDDPSIGICVEASVSERATPTGLRELARLMTAFAVAAPTVERLDAAAFDALLGRLHGQGDAEQEWVDALDERIDLAHLAEELSEPQDLLDAEDDAPIIRLINALLTQAVREDASDIHIEPFERRLSIRMRVDGVMRDVLNPPVTLAPLVVSRVKVMARLDIAEKRLPQDGRISLRVAGRAVDVRVSTLPSGHGERVVLRLLDKAAGRLRLDQIGMPPATLSSFRRTISRPHGIVLVTGPTGSGKTTTLYAALSELNDSSRNILTVEDPIEYFIDGIGQTQVNARIDMSFARGLRAILRQDPDVVMVGEIRDLETVQIAIQASLTGHTVFSTLHTNSAIGAITRLRDMGVEPFLLSSTLNGVLAQRLVRRLCPTCREAHQPDATECALLGRDAGDVVEPIFRAVGCPACNGQGYRGRLAVYEWVPFDDRLRELTHNGAGEAELIEAARRHSDGLRVDCARRVLSGETTLEEMIRVTQDDVAERL